MNTPHPYPLASAAFWRAYVVLLRPYLSFLSGVSGAVGLAVVPGLSGPGFLAACAAFFCSYGLGQALTDVFQTDTDALSSPYRPLTQGLVRPRDVLLVSLGGLGVCAATFLWLNPRTLVLSLLGVLGLVTYTPLKRRWWGGPPWNSAVVAMLPLIGALCGGEDWGALLAQPALPWLAGSVFFSYGVFVLLGYFKDISADRATGYVTLPVKVGWTAAVAASGFWALAALVCSGVALSFLGVAGRLGRPEGALALLAWVGGAGALAYAHPVMLRTRDEKEAHRSIAWTVRGYVWLHLGEAAAARPDLAWPALAYGALFEWVLRVRPEKTQI